MWNKINKLTYYLMLESIWHFSGIIISYIICYFFEIVNNWRERLWIIILYMLIIIRVFVFDYYFFFYTLWKNGNTLQEIIKHIKQYDLQIYVSNYRQSFNISDWWVKFHDSGVEKRLIICSVIINDKKRN